MTLTPSTRASLLLRLRDSQDRDAWAEFVSLYEQTIYRLLRHNGLQDADAREVLQELFLIVNKNIDRFEYDRDKGTFRGWLRRVTRNLVINWLKHRDRRLTPRGGTDMQSMLDLIPADGPESTQFDKEFHRTVFQRAAEKVRSEFHSETWQAFWETGVLGISPADTAKKLGMSVGAVRVAKCRVLARLRSAVTELESVS